MSPKIEIISKKLILGEGPHWDERTQSLYFIDIVDYSVHKYDPKTGLHTQAKVCNGGEPVTLIIPVEGETDKFLITSGCSLATVVWDGVCENVSDFQVLLTLDDGEHMRINDGKCSPSGVLFLGTMRRKHDLNNFDHGDGCLYSLRDLKPKKILDGVSISNGLAWTSDEKVFYFNDSPKYRVDCFNYNKESTEISNRRTLYDFKKNNMGDAFPDGMTIDSDGNLWIACYNASRVINIDPQNGKLLRHIEFQAQFITSVAFGGPNFEDLYVTSAQNEMHKYPDKPEDGFTFLVCGLGIRGVPAIRIQL